MRPIVLALIAVLPFISACERRSVGSATGPKIAVSFETLQTEAWVYSFEAIKSALQAQNAQVLEAVADNDSSRQLEQVNSFISRKVNGIILVPRDKDSAMKMIKRANEASVPIVLFNRPPADPNANCTTIVADNVAITKATVEHMCQVAKKSNRKHKAMVLIGDLSDENAVGRWEGFKQAVAQYPDVIEVVAEIRTEWNQEKALAGVTAAYQANPDISFIFTSSDFMLPSIISILKQRGIYKKVGEQGHVILGGFDGDQTAWRLLEEGYLDADGVQDFEFEAREAVRAVLDLARGKTVPRVIRDPGLVAHQGNKEEARQRMWGAKVKSPR